MEKFRELESKRQKGEDIYAEQMAAMQKQILDLQGLNQNNAVAKQIVD